VAQQSLDAIDPRLVRAVGHPLRARILAVLNQKVASPAQMTQEFDETLSRVSYHVNVLLKYKCIELVRTRPRRGAVEHFYRGTSRAYLNVPEWPQLPQVIVDDEGSREIAAIMTETLARILQAQANSADRLTKARKNGKSKRVDVASVKPPSGKS
jgi:DNA-binding transcriptional ArsR family regulator